MLRRFFLAVLFMCLSGVAALGHALEPGYLDVRQLTPDSWQIFWRKPDVAGAPMAIDVTLPDTCTPAAGPAPNYDGAAWISSWVSDCPGGLVGGMIEVPGLSAQRTDVLLRLQALERTPVTLRLTPDQTSHIVPAEPSALGVFSSYATLGFDHILEGWDHLLFVFALLMLIRNIWRLVGAITAFTIAHSITLALATLGHISVPGPPVEAVIALSIIFMAVEILKSHGGNERLSERAPWLISFAFGLLHGLGFAGALRDIGLPQQDIGTALLAFNVGVEAGQLAFVGVVLLVVGLIRRAIPIVARQWQMPGSPFNTALGYAVGSVATFWFVERVMSF